MMSLNGINKVQFLYIYGIVESVVFKPSKRCLEDSSGSPGYHRKQEGSVNDIA